MTLYVGDQLITPTIPGSGGGSPVQKYGLSIDSFIGNVSNGTLNAPVMETSNIVFNGVTDLGDNALKYAFNGKAITSASFPNLASISGNYALKDTFGNSSLTSVSFLNLVNITGQGSFENAFASCVNLSSVSFPNLVSIIGVSSFSSAFQSTFSLTSISLPKLQTINGGNCMQYAFSNSGLISISFDSLETIRGDNACASMFSSCTSLERIDFPKLKNVDLNVFGSEEWQYIFAYCSDLTEIHFRADMANVIPNMYGYADKWGAENATIYFDLASATVEFDVTPSQGTSIYVDGNLISGTTAKLSADSNHTYVLNNSNYPIYYGIITGLVEETTTTITKDLTQITGHKITINTNVGDCTVTIDGNTATTVTSTSYESDDIYSESSITVGYTVEKEGYKSQSGTVTFNNSDISINVTLISTDIDLSNWTYTLDENNNAIITGYTGPEVTTLEIPTMEE